MSEQNQDKDKEKLSEEKKQSTTALKATNTGMLVGKNLAEQYKLAEAYCKSGFLPTHFDTPAKALTGMQYAYELGLKPLSAMRQICIIKGTPSIFGNLPLALVRQSGLLDYIKEYLFDDKGEIICMDNKNLNSKPIMAVCKIKRIGDPEEIERSFSHDEAEKAKLFVKDTWLNYEKTMLKYRARGAAINDCFPDVIAGMAIAEYTFNDLPKDENEVVVATSEEIKDDLDKTMSDFKIELLNSVKNTIKLIEEKDPSFNAARKIQYYNEHLKTTEIGFATEANLEDLIKALNLRLEVLKAERENEIKENSGNKKTEKKSEAEDLIPPNDRELSNLKCIECGGIGYHGHFMTKEGHAECPSCGSKKIESVE